MDFKLIINPLPFPHTLNELSTLKLILGVALVIAGLLVFSLWNDRLRLLKDEERTRFLMFNFVGGSWLLAVFAVCGGIYFFCDSLFQLHL